MWRELASEPEQRNGRIGNPGVPPPVLLRTWANAAGWWWMPYWNPMRLKPLKGSYNEAIAIGATAGVRPTRSTLPRDSPLVATAMREPGAS